MSIYTQLLDTALGQIPSTEEELTPGEALTELFRCRTVLGAGLARTGSNWAPAAVSESHAMSAASTGRVTNGPGSSVSSRRGGSVWSNRTRPNLPSGPMP